jgi:WD40 repeat protein
LSVLLGAATGLVRAQSIELGLSEKTPARPYERLGVLRDGQEAHRLTEPEYKAFVSYNHECDERFAASLQSSLSRFAKPWYRLRNMRIFRDETNLSANPALWHSIEQALSESEYFLLLACPSSAGSRWVQQEVEWWLQNRSIEKLLIVLTDGVIAWDHNAQEFDWAKTTALPSCLKSAFPSEPLFADFRAAKTAGKHSDSDEVYRSALLDVAAPLTGRPKDDLDSEDLRLHRKAQRTALAAVLFIVVLGLIAGVGMITASQRQKVAASRALASEATSQLNDRSLALLLSLESRRIADTVESRRSLLTTLQRVPRAEAFLWGHTDAVTEAVFSPDGQTVLSAGWDDRIILWSVPSHQPMGQPLMGPKGLVSVAFNSDGSRFASAGSKSIVIWDASSRKPTGGPFEYGNESFVHVAFSSNGKLLAASTDAYGGHPARVVVWDLAGHQMIEKPIEGATFAFSPDDVLLAVGQYEDLVFYDLRSHHLVKRPLVGHTKNISTLAFSRDGAIVATGSEDKSIVLWDVKGQRPLGTLTGHTGAVTSLAFDPSRPVLLSGSADGTIMRWDLDDLKAMDTPVKNFGASISSIFFSPDGHVKSLVREMDRAIILNVNDDPPLGHRIRAAGVSSSNVAFSPDSRFLASSGDFGDVLEWDLARAEPTAVPLSGHERQVSSLAYAPDGKVLVSGSMDGTVIFWDMDSHTSLGPPIKGHRSPVWSLACNPDGKSVVSGGDAELVFWDLAARKQLGPPVTSQKDRIWALAFSPSGKFLASAGNEHIVAIWKSGHQTEPFKSMGTSDTDHYREVTPAGASFNPEGTLLAMSTPGDSVTIWNFGGGRLIPPVLYGHTQSVSSVHFRRDGKVLASGSQDGDIRLWDVETHELFGILNAEQKAVHDVVFSQQKDMLASVGEDDSIILWDVDFESWSRRACRIANRNLTPKEWGTYFRNRAYRKTCPDL